MKQSKIYLLSFSKHLELRSTRYLIVTTGTTQLGCIQRLKFIHTRCIEQLNKSDLWSYIFPITPNPHCFSPIRSEHNMHIQTSNITLYRPATVKLLIRLKVGGGSLVSSSANECSEHPSWRHLNSILTGSPWVLRAIPLLHAWRDGRTVIIVALSGQCQGLWARLPCRNWGVLLPQDCFPCCWRPLRRCPSAVAHTAVAPAYLLKLGFPGARNVSALHCLGRVHCLLHAATTMILILQLWYLQWRWTGLYAVVILLPSTNWGKLIRCFPTGLWCINCWKSIFSWYVFGCRPSHIISIREQWFTRQRQKYRSWGLWREINVQELDRGMFLLLRWVRDEFWWLKNLWSWNPLLMVAV